MGYKFLQKSCNWCVCWLTSLISSRSIIYKCIHWSYQLRSSSQYFYTFFDCFCNKNLQRPYYSIYSFFLFCFSWKPPVWHDLSSMSIILSIIDQCLGYSMRIMMVCPDKRLQFIAIMGRQWLMVNYRSKNTSMTVLTRI